MVMNLFSALMNRDNNTTNPAGTLYPRLIHAPPSDFSNAVLEEAQAWLDEFGYRCYTSAFPNINVGRDPFEALDLALASRDDWEEIMIESTPPDIEETVVVNGIGGGGHLANEASPFPEARTGSPVINVDTFSHRLRNSRDEEKPATQEARNAALAYQLMDADQGHVLVSHGRDRVGLTETATDIGMLVALMPRFDWHNFLGDVVTVNAQRLDVGNTIKDLRDKLQDALLAGHENPWFVQSDFNWWTDDIDSPLKESHAGRAFALLPQRFADDHVDVQVRGAPDIEQTRFESVDDAFLIVVRGIEYSYFERIREESFAWLVDEIEEPDSEYGDEWRRLCRIRNANRDPRAMLDELLERYETIE